MAQPERHSFPTIQEESSNDECPVETLDSTRETLEYLQNEVDNYIAQYKENEEKIEEMNADYQKTIKELHDEHVKHIDMLREKFVQELEDVSNEQDKERDLLQEMEEKKFDEVYSEQLNNVYALYKTELDHLVQSVNDLDEENREKEIEIVRLKKRYIERKRAINLKEKLMRERHNQEIMYLKQEINVIQTQIKEMAREWDSETKRIQLLTDNIHSLMNMIEKKYNTVRVLASKYKDEAEAAIKLTNVEENCTENLKAVLTEKEVV